MKRFRFGTNTLCAILVKKSKHYMLQNNESVRKRLILIRVVKTGESNSYKILWTREDHASRIVSCNQVNYICHLKSNEH